MSPEANINQVPIEDLTPEQASHIIHSHRKVRYEDSEPLEMSRYVGQNSIPALLRDQPSPIETKDGVDIRRDMRPIFGLENSAPFPLMSPGHLERMTQDIFSELPSDREVMKLFRAYKEITHPFWGFVLDIDDLESRIMIYLEERAKKARENEKPACPVSASWLAVLFAVMAVGSQYHDSPYHVRTRDSQRYVQISFHFLRQGNFLLRPNLNSIQALLIVAFVLLNDMKAEASWALIGMACRLAQSLGLHRTRTNDENTTPEMSLKNFARRKLWPNMTIIQCCPIPISPNTCAEGLSYLEAMYHLCDIISKRLNPDAVAEYTYEAILDNCRAVESLRERVYPQIRSKDACKTVVDRLQHFAIRLHTSFVVSVCCRPSLRRDCTHLHASEKQALADKCKDNLTETVRMFLAMHQISNIPTRSWAFTYHGLSSAVLLGILCETKQDLEIRGLHGDLIAALSATAAKERSSPSPDYIRKSDRDIELSGPLSRALTALRNIYDYGTLHGVASSLRSETSASASGTRTPTNTALLSQQNFAANVNVASQQQQQYRGPQSGYDRHQDAALAMAELQNGSGLADFSSVSTPISFQNSMQSQQVGIPDFGAVDPATLAPMDLYDSIFWESPDPFYNVADMNFEFLPQAPPGQSQQQFYF
ncbi:hypothetical protein DL766_005347 [Monosporascus sp. MC13-8B]|uniref:Xylanolytic transcriptional activator regulatory domain-containing protein n=1 Tax=Monosporascus cannonballus TaxID=155416 RepID=A0ABY0H915_9PEZI|nr:hypothetical protein DL762_003980 [Monosporascus cannonballus]RYO95125.1 hypothetical protein DL763_003823 [Monosporascus cannonballus]RYP29479.1 hypothetical protein DL766_005347 [Monosporascus sp. MC13-8B]